MTQPKQAPRVGFSDVDAEPDSQGYLRMLDLQHADPFTRRLKARCGELLMAGAQEGSAAYVGFERIVGRVNGREGSFVLQHVAAMSRAGQTASWTILPEAGTGELRGIRGEAQIGVEPDGGHTFSLDYELE